MADPDLHFDKAPIREAIIAIQIHDLPDSTVNELRRLPDRVTGSYPQNTELTETKFVGQLGPQGPTASANQKVIGLQFQSTDSKQIFQARVNGFSFHRLTPYESWPPFRDEAFRLWTIYRQIVGIVKTVNFSVRYINSLTVSAVGKLEDYVTVYPEIPPNMPQTLSTYFMRLELPLKDEGSGEGTLTLTQNLLRSESGKETTSILLDNVFLYPADNIEDNALWQKIDAVREVKNRVFVAALTPEMRKRIS